MNGYDIALIIVIALVAAGAVFSYVRRRKKGKGCCGNCSCCDGCSACRQSAGEKTDFQALSRRRFI